MTLRENSSTGHEIPPLHRKYSVSHSGRFKSRPKIRPSLSGDVFRPEPQVNANAILSDDFRTEDVQRKPLSSGSQQTVEQLIDSIGDTDSGNTPSVQQMHQHHQDSKQSLQQRPTSAREILETSL